MARPTDSKREPKPGKGRRRLKTLVVLLVVAALLVALVAWLAQSDLVRGRVLDLARARLSETLGRDVEVGGLDYSLRPLQVVATDVVIPGTRPGEPFAVVPRVRVEMGFEGLFNPTLNIEEVEVTRPEVWLTFYDDGTTSLPDVRTGQGGGRLEVVIGHLMVEDGVAHLDQREIPLSVDASPVRVVAEGPGAAALPEDHLVAQVHAQELSALLPDAERWGGSATARAEISPGRVRVTGGLLSGPDLTARFEAVYAFGDEADGGRHGEVEVRARGRARLVNRLGYLEEPISGPFRFDGEVQLSDADGTRYGGTFTSPGLDFLERTFEDVTAEVEGGDEGLVVEVEEAGYAGGILVGTLTLPAEETLPAEGEGEAEQPEGRPAHLEAQARNLVLARLVDDLDLEDTFLSGLRGRAGAELTYRFRTDAAQSGSGEGTLRLAGVERASSDGRLPVSGRVPLVIRNGVVLVQDARLEAPGQVVTASGNYDLPSGTGSFQYRLVSEDLGLLADTVPLPPELTADGTPLWMVESGTGTVEGRVSVGPGGSLSVEASGELANVRTGLFDFDRVRAPIRLEDGVLSIRDGLFESLAQRLEIDGTYDLEGGAAEGEFRLLSDDLGELGELAAAVLPGETVPADGPRPPWLPSGGEGTVEGNLRRTADGALSGRLELDLADVDLPAPAADGTGGVRLDRLAGSFRLRPGELRDLRLEATSGGGALMASGTVPLPTAGAGDADTADPDAWQRGPLSLDLDMVDWPVSTLAALAAAGGEPLDATGRVTLEADLGGTLRRPEGDVQVTAEPLSVAGFDFQRLRADLALDGPRVVVDSARLVTPAGELVAAGSWNRSTGALDGRVATAGAGDPDQFGELGDLTNLADLGAGPEGLAATRGIDLAEPPLAELLPGSLQGRVALVAEVGGTVESPAVELVSATRGLRVDGRTLGEDGVARLAATWDGDTLRADGSLLGVVDFTGGGPLSTDAADLSLDLSVDDVDGLVRLVSEQPVEGLGGTVAGTLTVAGRFDAPAGPDVELLLDPVRLTYEGRRIENIEPVELALAPGELPGKLPGELEVRSLFVSMPDQRQSGELFVVGSVGLEEPYPLDLRLQAEMSARWLELVVDDSEMEGRIQALTTIGGTVAEPRLNGQGEILDGEMVFAAFPHALEDLDAVALFYPDRLVVDRVNARLGGGRLRAEGRIGLPGEVADDVSYRFQAQLDDASLRVPEGFLIRGDANLTLVSSEDGRLVSGVVDLERAFYLQDVPVGVTQLLRTVFEPTRLEAGTADPLLAGTQLNVAVSGPGALRVRNNVADLTGDVDLVVRGSLADPALFGQVELDSGGEVVYSENEYEVERGLITFSNPYRIDPVIDFVATTEVRNYDITLNLSGTLDRLEATFSSDPPLANLEVVSLLTVGRPIEEGALTGGGAVGGGGGAAGAAEELLYGQAASLLSERVNTLFGFDRFRVTPTTGATSGSGLAVTVGQQISRDVYVTYSRDPALPEVDIVQVEWQVYDNVVVVLTSNGDRTYTLDVQIENRF